MCVCMCMCVCVRVCACVCVCVCVYVCMYIRMYINIYSKRLYRLFLFKSRCTICHSIGTDRDETSMNVHLSLYVPKQRTKIEGGGKDFSLCDLWLSPVLFCEFPSISPTASKETIDRTPKSFSAGVSICAFVPVIQVLLYQ